MDTDFKHVGNLGVDLFPAARALEHSILATSLTFAGFVFTDSACATDLGRGGLERMNIVLNGDERQPARRNHLLHFFRLANQNATLRDPSRTAMNFGSALTIGRIGELLLESPGFFKIVEFFAFEVLQEIEDGGLLHRQTSRNPRWNLFPSQVITNRLKASMPGDQSIGMTEQRMIYIDGWLHDDRKLEAVITNAVGQLTNRLQRERASAVERFIIIDVTARYREHVELFESIHFFLPICFVLTFGLAAFGFGCFFGCGCGIE